MGNGVSLVKLVNVKKYFPSSSGLKSHVVKAVDGISLEIRKGETLGLVGESGCGKSTLGRAVLRLFDITSGNVYFNGKDIYSLSRTELLRTRKHMQIIFQDPLASLNPRLRVQEIVAEPLRFHKHETGLNKKAQKTLVDETLKAVGLDPDVGDRYPHEFSGGQQQRIGIARALILKPEFLVCDEAVSALDVSVQAQVLNLLKELKDEYALTYLFISHNLSVIKHICDRIAVMYLGEIVELADTEKLFANPLHPYTKALISAIPLPDPDKKRDRILLNGDLPSPANPPPGCRFHTRCYQEGKTCNCQAPDLVEVSEGHFIKCHKFANWTPQPFHAN